MATALSDANLKKYKTQIDEITTQIKGWTKILSDAEATLNSSVGATFKANYAVGNKAVTNSQKIIDILHGLRNDLYKLIDAGNAFYTTSYNASKK